ncbi:TPA: hypothetical protein PKO72_002723 [Aeromonas hydrophila]|uniref:hypothetical protein n=1 Tax=Aeromonas TaxID=642 RepID=UPI001CCCFE8B|nr:hypothetical protein [Aeromonas hydrophila]UBQ51095.1 hypothetical protein LCH17_02885 [Aeromonas hydrophila]HDI1213976.1 hypothetical protein [Aeromonas hydrophila]
MTEQNKQAVGVGHSLISSAGLGALLTFGASFFDPQTSAKLAAGIPIISPILAFLGAVAWNKWGCESPEMALMRSRLKRDARELKALISDQDIDEATRAVAKKDYGQTMLKLAKLGSSNLSGLNVETRSQSESNPPP